MAWGGGTSPAASTSRLCLGLLGCVERAGSTWTESCEAASRDPVKNPSGRKENYHSGVAVVSAPVGVDVLHVNPYMNNARFDLGASESR